MCKFPKAKEKYYQRKVETTKASPMKENIDKLDSFLIKNLCSAKDTGRE